MYKTFFGLNENPFNVNPDPRYLYQTPETRETLASLAYGIQQRRGFMLLTGEVGTGKTTLINQLLNWLRMERAATSFIFNPRLSEAEFLDFMMADFGIPVGSGMKSQVLLRLNQWLLDRYQTREAAVLIIDEAQNISLEVLEEIRLLTNLETSSEKLLQIVLSGQPELELKLKLPALRQLRQRITLRSKTLPLNLEQTRGYISRRLATAGANGQAIFESGAVESIFLHSRGIPRVINLLCEHSLISAFAEGLKPVPAGIVETVSNEFELDEAPVSAPPEAEEKRPPAGVGSDLERLSELLDRLRRSHAGR
jgi:general secretion pathway protein A